MSTNDRQLFGNVYQFKRKAPASGVTHRQVDQTDPASAARGLPRVEFGDSWYHEAAIQVAKRSGKPSA